MRRDARRKSIKGFAVAIILLTAVLSIAAAAGDAEVVPVTADAVYSAVGAAEAKVVLVNVWSTWCGPCIDEFPDLVKLQKEYGDKGLKVIFVSGNELEDLPEVKEFLAQQKVDFRTYIMSGSPQAFIDGLNPQWSGALPFTMIFNGSSELQRMWEGAASYETFELRILEILKAD